MFFPELLIKKSWFHLSQWDKIIVTGNDRENFFQGQFTQDIFSISLNSSKFAARLNRAGIVQSYFYVARKKETIEVFIPKNLTNSFLNEINKFIIMDDVEFKISEDNLYFHLNSFSSDEIEITISGLLGFISSKSGRIEDQLHENDLSPYALASAWPDSRVLNRLINETILNELAISYKKGCFLGQETVAKIENNRGASYSPVILKINSGDDISLTYPQSFDVEGRKGGEVLGKFNWLNSTFLLTSLFRDFRVIGKKIELILSGKKIIGEIVQTPLLNLSDKKSYNQQLLDISQSLFLNHQETKSLEFLYFAETVDPSDPEILEMIGAILGRQNKFEEAIEYFNRLEIADPTSVMANTNKSLYLMKLGRISEAEDEKSKATVKSFAKNADEAKIKKQIEEEKQKKIQELIKREGMFKQVLEIDPEDTVAHQGLGDVYFQNGNFEKALQHLEMALSFNDKLSVSYLLAAKSFLALKMNNEAKKILEVGIAIASKQGDMMPANEMQSLFNKNFN